MRGDAERKKENRVTVSGVVSAVNDNESWWTAALIRTDEKFAKRSQLQDADAVCRACKRCWNKQTRCSTQPGHSMSPHALVPLGDSYFTPVSTAVVTCCPLSCQGHLEEDDKICILGRFRLVSSYWRHLWGISFKSLSMSRPLWLYSAKNEGRPTSLSWHERMTSLLDPLARCKHEYSTWILVWLKLVQTVACDANASWRHEKGKYRITLKKINVWINPISIKLTDRFLLLIALVVYNLVISHRREMRSSHSQKNQDGNVAKGAF